jgi:hypothetical protein
MKVPRKKRWLTLEERSWIPEWRRRWTNTGFCTEPADRDAAGRAIYGLYAGAGLAAPNVVWCKSPLAQAIALDFIRFPLVQAAWFGRSVRAPLRLRLDDSLRASVESAISESVARPLRNGVWKPFVEGGNSALWLTTAHRIRQSVRGSVPEGPEAVVEDFLVSSVQRTLDLHRVFTPVRRWIRRSVLDSLAVLYGGAARNGAPRAWPRIPRVGHMVHADPNEVLGGQFTANGAALTDYVRFIARAPQMHDMISNLGLLAASAGSIVPRVEVCWVVERPVVASRDAAGRLHAAPGPALVYEDGWALHFWHGVPVSRRWLALGEKLDPLLVLNWPQAEQRRALAEIAGGWDAVVARLPTRVVNEDAPSIGTLLECLEPNMPSARFLRVRCGTGRTFVLPVPDSCRTAREANAWTYGIAAHGYEPQVRT